MSAGSSSEDLSAGASAPGKSSAGGQPSGHHGRGSAVRRYCLAVGLVAAATVLTLKTQPTLGEISSFFFLAVMLGTWFGGLRPGLLATVLAGWASAYFFYDIPAGTGVFGWDDALRLVVFLSVCLTVSFLVNLRRKAEQQLRLANETLERRVRERTAELENSNRLVRESEEGFRALVEGVTDSAICLLDPGGRVVRWNGRAERIQGYREPEILGRPFDVFFSDADRVKARPVERLAAAAKSGRDEEEGWRVRRDGTTFWAHVIITALYDQSGGLRGFAHVARDITEIKRLQNEVIGVSEREQRRIGSDLHDGLGQELTGIAFLTRNVTAKLAERALPESAETERILGLINAAIEQTRDLARGLSPVEWGPEGLTAALRSLTLRTQDLYGIPCRFDCRGVVEVPSHNAAENLYRIAQEAAGNAARHSGAGCIRISAEDDGDEVVLTVEDDGRGLTGTAAKSGGTGLRGMGLRLMPYRARLIGARFDLRDRPGGGTIVRCRYRKPAASSADAPGNGVGDSPAVPLSDAVGSKGVFSDRPGTGPGGA